MSLTLQTRLSRANLAEGHPSTLYLLVQISAGDVPLTARPRLNLAAVVDRSGSMQGEKLAYTHKALRFLVDQTVPTDCLGIVAFDDQVQVVYPAEPVLNKDALKAQLAGIDARGWTNLSAGLLAGYREAGRHRQREQVNRVLLMTDGQANEGVTDPAALAAKARELNERGIQLSALGVGEDYNEDLLAEMARQGGGNFYHIENPDQIPEIFRQELSGLLSMAAQGLEVQFTAAHGVRVSSVVGYPPTGSPTAVELALPDIYAGEVKSLVLELQVEAAFAGTHPLGEVTLKATSALDGKEISLSQGLSIAITGDPVLLEAPEDPEVLKQLYMARSAEAQERAIREADARDFSAGSSALRAAAAPMAAMAQATGDADLRARAEELEEQAMRLDSQIYDATARKQMRAQSYQTRTGRRSR